MTLKILLDAEDFSPASRVFIFDLYKKFKKKISTWEDPRIRFLFNKKKMKKKISSKKILSLKKIIQEYPTISRKKITKTEENIYSMF